MAWYNDSEIVKDVEKLSRSKSSEEQLLEEINESNKKEAQAIILLEELRQGFADVLDLVLPYLPAHKQQVSLLTFEAYHKLADRGIVDLGGESVGRIYKN